MIDQRGEMNHTGSSFDCFSTIKYDQRHAFDFKFLRKKRKEKNVEPREFTCESMSNTESLHVDAGD